MKYISSLIIVYLVSINSVSAQLDCLPPSIKEYYRPSGWIYFVPNTINYNDLFIIHKDCFLTHQEDSMKLVRNWTDDILNLKHYRYQQTFLGIEVEGCEFTLHTDNEDNLVYANGKICPNISSKFSTRTISENEALNIILESYGDHIFSWEDSSHEESYQIDENDPNATTYPTGQLLFALENEYNVNYEMNPNDYRLAWKFEMYSINPDMNMEIYVDALNGQIFEVNDTREFDGLAPVSGFGNKIIDTKQRGWPYNDHILQTDNSDFNINTKYNVFNSWLTTSQISDSDDNWGVDQIKATSPHWIVGKTWSYFKEKFGREGMNNNNEVRVNADLEFTTFVDIDIYSASYDRKNGKDYINLGYYLDEFNQVIYSDELSILAHEFTHGINKHEGNLKYKFESGALSESFSDIFGFLTRNWVTGIPDWLLGITGTKDMDRKSLENPKLYGKHLNNDFTQYLIGQPNCYLGDYYYTGSVIYDFGGVHINSGVMNHWFYILSKGKSSTNDLGNYYSVFGIGIEKSAELTYYNFTNNMQRKSKFEDAMEGAIIASKLLYGECSIEHISTQNAWYAVGLGTYSECDESSIIENFLNFEISPNPVTDKIVISTFENNRKIVEVLSLDGSLVYQSIVYTDNEFEINMGDLLSGTYLVKLTFQNGTSAWKKVVKL
jgi:bacillolysin